MNKQANEVTVSFVESFESYASDSKAIGELKNRLEDARKILEPVIKAHKIPVDDNKAWKEKRVIFFPLVQTLELPIDDNGNKMDLDAISQTERKKMDARIAAWLGVIRTCLEYQILPTDKNADRLRKARLWTGLNGNGKVNPNWIDPKAPKIEAHVIQETTSVPTVTASSVVTETKGEPKTPPKAPSVSAATPQKASEPVHPLTSNVSSPDAPLSAREHCGILLDQLFKNEAFRGEFAPILAMCLDSNVATVTRCLVEARDAMLNGKGVK